MVALSISSICVSLRVIMKHSSTSFLLTPLLSYYKGFFFSTACVAASFLLLISAMLFTPHPVHPYSRPDSQTLESGLQPSSNTLPRLFQHDPTFSVQVHQQWADFAEFQNLSHEYDYIWENLTKRSGAFLPRYDVPSGTENMWGITMFHQLHCLQLIRGKIQRLLFPNESLTEEYAVHGDIATDHYLHCFDYLRQVYIIFPPIN